MDFSFGGGGVLEGIKRVILDVARRFGLRVEKIIFFGSRFRGDFRGDSDWDILIVVDGELDWRVRNDFWVSVRRRIEVPVDIIVVSSGYFERYRDDVGDICYYSVREGTVLWEIT
ncbi:MAG: nucleotidyltransferase domain-containing protein [archaeon GB-1867-035]|nr:nucleotidyltransferase domain-containing protein [Candidatus Culexmicrobium profundum]